MMATAVNAQQDPSQAQPAGQSQPGAKSMDLDKHFMKGVAGSNMFEIQLSQLAAQKAQDEKVKQFAQKMVQDHTKAGEELKQLAQSKGVQLPQQLPEMKQEELQIFQSLSGAEFDQAYKSCMKVGHAKNVAAFEEKSKHAKDAELKAWTAKTLPVLKQHKQHVMAMTGDKGDEAQTAGSREHAEHGAAGSKSSGSGAAGSSSGSSSSGGSGTGTSSSGSGSRETGSGTSTGGGTTGAGSTGGTSGGSR
jgi:putative membrane protein